MNSEQNILAKDFNGIQLFSFAFPTIIMMVFSGLYTIVDTIFVSHFVNTNALAAINIVTPVINLIVGLGTMLASGGNAIISRNMGAKMEQQARENFTLIIIIGGIVGVILAIIGSVWIDKVLHILGASDTLFGYAKDYLSILLVFFPAYLLQTVFANLFVTAGHPGLGSILSIASGILNIILDYVFIVIFDMGISGAAFGTGFGYLMPTVIGICFFMVCRNETLHFCKTKWKMNVIMESCLNGSSEMVSQLAMAVTVFLFNLNMMKLAGDDGVAAITIMNYSQFLLNTLFIGFSMGVAPVIGFNYGSDNIGRQKRILNSCLRFIFLTSFGIFAMSYFGGSIIVKMFADGKSNVFHLATEGFKLFSIGFIFCGLNIFTSSMFTALSNGKVSALLSFLRTFAFLTIAILVLPRIWGVTGIWLAIPFAEAMAFILSLFFIRKQLKYYNYKIQIKKTIRKTK